MTVNVLLHNKLEATASSEQGNYQPTNYRINKSIKNRFNIR